MLTETMTWNERFQIHNAEYNAVRHLNGFTTVWSCYTVEEDLVDWNEVPFPDMQVLKYDGVEVKVAPNATWLDLWGYAELLHYAKVGKYDHGRDHLFVERFLGETIGGKSTGVYHLLTGS